MAIAGILVTVILFTSIYSFNRAKFLVPPQLRGQPGVTEGRRRDRAARRAARRAAHPQRTGGRKPR